MEKSLKDLKLTSGELDRLEKAFKNPDFCKLFSDYAEELRDPENKKRYEEEIKMAELERGMDVKFINPTPHYVLKSRIWPTSLPMKDIRPKSKDVSEMTDGQKIFINICSSDTLAKPEVIQNGQQGAHWRIPHSFSPPQEDIDKDKKLCIICDVVFHPEAIQLGDKKSALRNLLYTTAIDGIASQFGLCLGLTQAHAERVWTSATRNKEAAERQTNMLACVRLLKGIKQKGYLRPTVIREKRDDFDDCQKKMNETDRAAFKEARLGPNSKAALSALSKIKSSVYDNPEFSPAPPPKDEPFSKYKTPVYKILHSTDVDMQHYTNDPDSHKPSRPDSLKVEILLPGILSAASLDLDITSRKIHLQAEKPKAYKLDLDLPYPIEPDKGNAKFNKANNKLLLTIPVVPLPPIQLLTNSQPSLIMLNQENCQSSVPGEKLFEVLSSAENGLSEIKPIESSLAGGHSKRRRRKKKHSTLVTHNIDKDHESSKDNKENLSINAPSSEVKNDKENRLICTTVKIHKVPLSNLVVPKANSFAPTRFRQDPSSFTMLLAIKNVVPESLELFWSPASSSGSSPPPLHLMVTCTSRGGGGCSLAWGVVLHCPANGASTINLDKMKGREEDEIRTSLCQKQGNTDEIGDDGNPDLICCDVSPANVTFTFYKPQLQIKQQPTASSTTWWKSVAVGRALGPGLQQVPVVGLAPFSNEIVSLTGLKSSSKPHPLTHPAHPHIMNVSTLYSQSVELSMLKSPSPPDMVEKETIESVVRPKHLRIMTNSMSMDAESKEIPLRGILKQRSTSESSLDEFQPHFGTSAAGTIPFSSTEFPTASNSESEMVDFPSIHPLSTTQMCHSPYDVQNSDDGDTSMVIPQRPRQRLHSVNFSRKDEKIAFSPMDPVETLHNTIKAKQKNVRRSERRRRNNSYTASCITLSEMQSIPGPPLNPQKKRQSKRKLERRQKQLSESSVFAKEEPHYPNTSQPVSAIHKTVTLSSTEADSGCPSSQSPEIIPSSESKRYEELTASSDVVERCDGEVLNWKELPSVQKRLNPHATVCPIALNADVIFELDDDDGC